MTENWTGLIVHGLSLILAMIVGLGSVKALSNPCDEKLLLPATPLWKDQRFHWLKQMPEFKKVLGGKIQDLSRQPPPIFPSVIAVLNTPHLKRLPRGLNLQQRKFFGGIFHLLRDLRRVSKLMTDVNSDLNRITATRPKLSRVQAMQRMMSTFESHFGISVEVVDHLITDEELMRFLRQGKTFVDNFGSHLQLRLSPEIVADSGHWQHGPIFHRLQLHLVLRDLLLRPDDYGRPNDVLSLYKQLGSEELQRKLNWSQTGIITSARTRHPTLFSELFDSHENNASSPGFFDEYKNYWPDIPLNWTLRPLPHSG